MHNQYSVFLNTYKHAYLQARQQPQWGVGEALPPTAEPAAGNECGQRLKAALIKCRSRQHCAAVRGAKWARAGGKQLDEGKHQVWQEGRLGCGTRSEGVLESTRNMKSSTAFRCIKRIKL